MTFEELKLVAEKMDGFKYDKRTGEDKLRDQISKHLEENPDCLKVEPDTQDPKVDPVTDPVDETKKPKKDKLVKIQSIHRGKISTSHGMIDFGTDGIAEVSAEAAEYLCAINGYEKC